MCVIILFIFIIMIVAKNITAKSGGYFVAQQKAVGKLNGYIEELINGQKVVKVFNYEERSKKAFDKLNENYRVNSYSAHKFSNILMPLLGNMANIEYVLIAIIGGAFAISGKIPSLTLGTIASFLASEFVNAFIIGTFSLSCSDTISTLFLKSIIIRSADFFPIPGALDIVFESPEIIARDFGLSKNAFKRGIGRLYKSGKIDIEENCIKIK